MGSPSPDELIRVADLCLAALEPVAGSDWTARAGRLEWSCRQTLEHLCSLAYTSQLATRAQSFRPMALQVSQAAPIDQLLWTMHVGAVVLAEVARAAPPAARAFHPAGMADASGWVAMGMDEWLIHTGDIAAGLAVSFEPEPDVARPVLDRLFPWWPQQADPWVALLWANGRASLPGHVDPGAEWQWHCAPLEDWDGTIPRWDPVRNRPASPS